MFSDKDGLDAGRTGVTFWNPPCAGHAESPKMEKNPKWIDDRRKAMSLEDLTEEQKAKARECKTPEEFDEFVKKENIELSLDELEAASGGYCDEKCWRDGS